MRVGVPAVLEECIKTHATLSPVVKRGRITRDSGVKSTALP